MAKGMGMKKMMGKKMAMKKMAGKKPMAKGEMKDGGKMARMKRLEGREL